MKAFLSLAFLALGGYAAGQAIAGDIQLLGRSDGHAPIYLTAGRGNFGGHSMGSGGNPAVQSFGHSLATPNVGGNFGWQNNGSSGSQQFMSKPSGQTWTNNMHSGDHHDGDHHDGDHHDSDWWRWHGGYGYGWGGYPGWGYGSYGYDYSPSYGYSTGYWPQTTINPAPVTTAPAEVVNPPQNGVPLSFMVNGQSYTVPPGTTQNLTISPGQTISFDRGNGQGTTTYSLSPGVYTFTPASQGWELFQTPLSTASAPSQPR